MQMPTDNKGNPTGKCTESAHQMVHEEEAAHLAKMAKTVMPWMVEELR